MVPEADYLLLYSTEHWGMASPSMKAFAGGQAAAYKMFDTINRKPEIDGYSTTGRGKGRGRGRGRGRGMGAWFPYVIVVNYLLLLAICILEMIMG
uniref:Uncharacterized protein n=1 Tax=Oryza brachyantha TaxID=4533 RepID=J3LYA4_ORYBR